MNTEIPAAVVRDSIELTRLLAEPSGRLFLELMEREVLTRIDRMLSINATDDEALKERHVVMAITGMVENGLLDHVRLAQGWMARKTKGALA